MNAKPVEPPAPTPAPPAPRGSLVVEFWRWLRRQRVSGLRAGGARLLRQAFALVDLPTPEPEQLLRRIITMERDLILPLKAAGIAMLLHSFYFTPWIGRVVSELEIAVELTQYFLWFYIAANLAFAVALFNLRRLPLGLVQWLVFVTGLLDGLFLSALTLVTGGYHSFLYWLFLGLIVRSAVSVPRGTSQLALNFTLIACYVIAGIINIYVFEYVAQSWEQQTQALAMRRQARVALVAPVPETGPPTTTNLSLPPLRLEARPPPARAPDEGLEALMLTGPEGDAEPLAVRLILLVLMTSCAYGVQVLLDRQRRALEDAREFAVRDAQLRSAGRFAAEFAHQIKNPLAIINTAAFSLQRALEAGRADAPAKVRMIQEEVERADRIITEVMGYAQLSEGKVEKLNVTEEMERAIERVFPPAAGYPVRVRRQYPPALPPLVMQKRHASEIFINILQNAREALGEAGGEVSVSLRLLPESLIEAVIADNGPGVPPDKIERIFQAYYTTKPRGSGLGLATVKNTVELYGGTVRVESELGRGALFRLVFPARTLMKLARQP